MSSASTIATDFLGTPNDAQLVGLPRRFIRTTGAGGSTFWREEVAGAAGSTEVTITGGQTTVTFTTASRSQVKPAPGSIFGVQFTTGSITRVEALTTLSRVQVEGQTSALITTASRIQIEGNTTAVISSASKVQTEPGAGAVFPISGNTTALITTASKIRTESTGTVTVAGNTTVSPAAGTTFLVRPVATPVGEMTLETGTTVISTFANRVSSLAGTTALVTSGAGRVRVLSFSMQQSDTGSTVPQLVQFLSSNTTINGAPEYLLGQREGAIQVAPTGAYLFQTATGEALNLSLSTNVKTMTHVVAVRTT